MPADREQSLVGDINAIGAPISIIDVLPNGRFAFRALNRLSEEYFGKTHDQLAGRELGDFRGLSELDIRLRKRAIVNFKRCVETRSQFHREMRHEFADGTHRWAQSTFVPIFGESGDIEQILLTSVEITELKETRKRLEDALTHVLSGFLSICASCKSIRDEANRWTAVERYVTERTGVLFSHGLCPDCLEKAIHEDEE